MVFGAVGNDEPAHFAATDEREEGERSFFLLGEAIHHVTVLQSVLQVGALSLFDTASLHCAILDLVFLARGSAIWCAVNEPALSTFTCRELPHTGKQTAESRALRLRKVCASRRADGHCQ